MAERRMFAKSIVFSDAFLDMSVSTRMLYFYLSMSADDEGVVNSPKSIMRQCGASNDDMNVLILKKFILPVDETGVYVIKHWFIHNYIQTDRFKTSKYHEELGKFILDENKSYKCIQDGYKLDTQDRLDKDSKDKSNKHIVPDGIKTEFEEYIKMRKMMKKPLTSSATRRALHKLQDMSQDVETQKKILNQSVDHCWLDLYPLKHQEDKLPEYDDSKNRQMSDEELEDLLKLANGNN